MVSIYCSSAHKGYSNISCAPEWRRHVGLIRENTDLAIETDVANALTCPGRAIGLLDNTSLVVVKKSLNTVGKFEMTGIAANFKSVALCTLAMKIVAN